MAKVIQYEILDDTKQVPSQAPSQEKPREFKGRVVVKPDGTKEIVVETQNETIVHPDGRKDVIIHAPTLEMINKAKALGN